MRIPVSAVLSVLLVVFAGGILLAAAAPAEAQGYRHPREGRWQLTIPINYVGSKSFEGEGGSKLDLSDDLGWGFGFGYHVSERFLLGGEFTWLSSNYQATIPVDDNGDGNPDRTTEVGGILDASTIQGVVQFHLTQRQQFTPFVRGNLGWTLLDTNIPAGPPTGSCWWHPYWGYICDVWQPTYGKNSFSYGGAVGVRGQLGNTFFLEGSVGGAWVDFGAETPFLPGGRLTIGWIF